MRTEASRLLPSGRCALLAVCAILALHPTPCLSQKHPSYKEHLSEADTLMTMAKPGEGNHSHSLADLQSEWPHLFSPALFQQELWRALAQLSANGSFMERLGVFPNVSATCVNHTEQVLTALFERKLNALSMIDSMGKPSPDILLFNLKWPGALKECLNVAFMNTSSSPQQPMFRGEYCTASITLAQKTAQIPMPFTVSTGICVPDSCSSLDITIFMNEILAALKIHFPQAPYAVCQDREGPALDSLAIGGITVVAIFLALMVVGTVLDVAYTLVLPWRRREKVDARSSNYQPGDEDINGGVGGDSYYRDNLHFNGTGSSSSDGVLLLSGQPTRVCELGVVGKALMAFSVYTNGAKLLNTDQAAGTLSCVHGVRFLSMTWVVLGHTFLFPLYASSNLIGYISVALKRWTFQGIINATVSVDSFFVLSGLLVGYLSLKEMKKNNGSMNWIKFILHRFWRLTPAYMLVIFVYLSLWRYWGSGPLWDSNDPDSQNCKTSWWTNMLYINNFFLTDKGCLGQAWYLANDMQFYLLSPFIFVPFFYSPVYGMVAALVFLLATTIPPAAITMTENIQSSLIPTGNTTVTNNNMFDDYYIKPYNRMGPYIIGMVTGYVLYRTDCKVKINKILNLLCWAAAAAIALAVLYGLYEVNQGHPLALPVQALYNSVARTAWGAAVAWVIFACVTGNGGYVNTILSWKALIPLSRLTYCIYLLHIMILKAYIFNRDTTFYYSDSNIVVLFLALLVVCYMVSAVVSMAFEAPMMALEKLLLNRKKTE
ncbi:hypothetical protein ACOMHN_053857 [Nucella lapillus]